MMKLPAILVSILAAVLPLSLLAVPAARAGTASHARAAAVSIPESQSPPSDDFMWDASGHCWSYSGSSDWLTMSAATPDCNYWDATYIGNELYKIQLHSNGKCLTWSTTQDAFELESTCNPASKPGQEFFFYALSGGSYDEIWTENADPAVDCAQANGDGNPVLQQNACSSGNPQMQWYSGL